VKTKFRNVTITLEEDLALWARIEAARNDTSVSRFLAEMLRDRMVEKSNYDAAKRRALTRRPFPKSDDRYLTREEVHDRANLR
jgi:hypothetical protein